MVKLRGASGSLKQSYLVVARLLSWQIENGVLTARAVDVDPIALETGGPFSIAVDMGRRQWVWTTVEIREMAPAFRALLVGSPVVQ